MSSVEESLDGAYSRRTHAPTVLLVVTPGRSTKHKQKFVGGLKQWLTRLRYVRNGSNRPTLAVSFHHTSVILQKFICRRLRHCTFFCYDSQIVSVIDIRTHDL